MKDTITMESRRDAVTTAVGAIGGKTEITVLMEAGAIYQYLEALISKKVEAKANLNPQKLEML